MIRGGSSVRGRDGGGVRGGGGVKKRGGSGGGRWRQGRFFQRLSTTR